MMLTITLTFKQGSSCDLRCVVSLRLTESAWTFLRRVSLSFSPLEIHVPSITSVHLPNLLLSLTRNRTGFYPPHWFCFDRISWFMSLGKSWAGVEVRGRRRSEEIKFEPNEKMVQSLNTDKNDSLVVATSTWKNTATLNPRNTSHPEFQIHARERLYRCWWWRLPVLVDEAQVLVIYLHPDTTAQGFSAGTIRNGVRTTFYRQTIQHFFDFKLVDNYLYLYLLLIQFP